MNIGDTIRDIEDADCYIEGVVVSLNPLTYKVEKEVWNGEVDYTKSGTIQGQEWWYVEVINST